MPDTIDTDTVAQHYLDEIQALKTPHLFSEITDILIISMGYSSF